MTDQPELHDTVKLSDWTTGTVLVGKITKRVRDPFMMEVTVRGLDYPVVLPSGYHLLWKVEVIKRARPEWADTPKQIVLDAGGSVWQHGNIHHSDLDVTKNTLTDLWYNVYTSQGETFEKLQEKYGPVTPIYPGVEDPRIQAVRDAVHKSDVLQYGGLATRSAVREALESR